MEIILLLGLIFIRRIQPIMIVLRLIIVTLIYSVRILELIGSYWYRYLLVLVVIRGVLVIFSYIARLIPNEEFEILRLINFIIVGIIVFERRVFSFANDLREISFKIWEVWIIGVNIFIVVYLLVVMVIVVWLRGKEGQSLRI